MRVLSVHNGSVGLALAFTAVFILTLASARAANPSGFVIKRGVNASHWLSQSERRGAEREAFFTRKDVAYIASIGFDHIRLPIDEVQMWDEQLRPQEDAFKLLTSALDWCQEYNLRVIVDLHVLRSHHFNEGDRPLWTQPAAQERLMDCWRQLSDRLKSRPVDMVAYEILNEPVAPDPEDWNRLIAKATKVIREREPNRVLVFGSNMWQIPDTFNVLKVPEGDKNIILSFHCYTPMLLTHHKAGWTSFAGYTGPVYYPGQTVRDEDMKGLPESLLVEIRKFNGVFDRDVLNKLVNKAVVVAKKKGLQLYCGEWGCYPQAPRDALLRYYADFRSVLESNGIAWATWNYNADFPIVVNGTPDEELIRVLLK
jgi:endoglucanase